MLRALGEAVAEEGVVDMLSVSRGFSMDVITKSALGWQVNCHKNSSHPLLASVLGVMSAKDSIIEHCFCFPALRKVLKWLYPFATYYRVTTEITSALHETIKLRRSGASPHAGDILQHMLDAQVCAEGVTRKLRNHVMRIEDRHILASSFSFLVAGFDTTASALAFIIHLLAKYPEEQDRIFSEMQQTFSEEAELTYDGVQQLKRLDMVISETLRLYPPVVFFISRLCRATTTLMGHFIPAGVNVVVPTWHIHHDPELWHEPFKFLPERFAEGEKHHPAAYLPFGLGPRQCIGKRFALLELKFAVCRIVGKYKIYQCERTQDPLKLVVPSVNINPKQGVYVRLKVR
ncbi:cytochrome P450 3A7 [Ixodes scapularis]